MNLERIENKLKRLQVQLESEGKNANVRMVMAVEDCIQPDITDKQRTKLYSYCRTQAEIQGYIQHLPPSGARDMNPALIDSMAFIEEQINLFVEGGLNNSPATINLIRPKANKANITHHEADSLRRTMFESSKRYYENAYKNKLWDGAIDTIPNVPYEVNQ
jgi:hypothetical protein